MAFTPLRIGIKEVTIQKAIAHPNFSAKTVLVSDAWNNVEMWLKRTGPQDTLFYWEQARHFFGASVQFLKRHTC